MTLNKDQKKQMIEMLGLVSADMAADAKDFDGKPFTGKTVGTYLGYQGAAIAALADILKELLEDE